jgi:ADP-ribosyl-[dinitrogen reductase] hydrolase
LKLTATNKASKDIYVMDHQADEISNGQHNLNATKSALLGIAIGDALGVPVEFRDRSSIQNNPVTDMRGYGTYNLPAGTWSDDSSLAFCLAEALTRDFDLKVIGENFVKWLRHNYWTAHGSVFDVGITTRDAINRIAAGTAPELAGGSHEDENGNGSLMRILPLVFYIKDKPIGERYQLTKLVSSITHAHIRSVVACFYYLEFARHLLNKEDKFTIYTRLKTDIPQYLHSISVNPKEISRFDRLLVSDIYELSGDDVYSSGYVLHTLQASIWCLLTTDTYKDAVLKAVNMGEDTDTTGAVTGGLAGILYGYQNIPAAWLDLLARRTDIEDLAERMATRLYSEQSKIE